MVSDLKKIAKSHSDDSIEIEENLNKNYYTLGDKKVCSKDYHALKTISSGKSFDPEIAYKNNRITIENRRVTRLMLKNYSWLEDITDSISELEMLTDLDISGAGVTSIDESISNLQNLKYVDISQNGRLKEIPESIGEISNLRYIWGLGCKDSVKEGLKKIKSKRPKVGVII